MPPRVGQRVKIVAQAAAFELRRNGVRRAVLRGLLQKALRRGNAQRGRAFRLLVQFFRKTLLECHVASASFARCKNSVICCPTGHAAACGQHS